MLYKKLDNTLIDFFAHAERYGYRENENGPLVLYKEYIPQEIIDLAEAMIREKENKKGGIYHEEKI